MSISRAPMLFTLVQGFSPADGERWTTYCEWRGLNFERFDSLDTMMRRCVFDFPSDTEWEHVVNENFMLHLMTDLEFARRKQTDLGAGEIIGLKFSDHEPHHPGFLGYDILDGCVSFSLLTNWGNGIDLINRSLASNALVPNLVTAEDILDLLLREHSEDNHVKGCRIVSVYEVDPPRG